jgi:hypothetical protein
MEESTAVGGDVLAGAPASLDNAPNRDGPLSDEDR